MKKKYLNEVKLRLQSEKQSGIEILTGKFSVGCKFILNYWFKQLYTLLLLH
jgi:hypothetical protein